MQGMAAGALETTSGQREEGRERLTVVSTAQDTSRRSARRHCRATRSMPTLSRDLDVPGPLGVLCASLLWVSSGHSRWATGPSGRGAESRSLHDVSPCGRSFHGETVSRRTRGLQIEKWKARLTTHMGSWSIPHLRAASISIRPQSVLYYWSDHFTRAHESSFLPSQDFGRERERPETGGSRPTAPLFIESRRHAPGALALAASHFLLRAPFLLWTKISRSA
ncbi:hypothetical protein K438DRAFT_658241 [Mycena galopus ATCC 62051]|nr:hypothetical protein K438DRAFT_658241 [Mycena galopus ATCC 62051]